MPFTVRIDPNNTQQQACIIPDATPRNAGVMTAAQAAKLASIPEGDGGRQNFSYTIQSGDGSDFFVPLPIARTDVLYTVLPNQTKGAIKALVDCPNAVVGDRTVAQFRVVTSTALAAGDEIEFNVASAT